MLQKKRGNIRHRMAGGLDISDGVFSAEIDGWVIDIIRLRIGAAIYKALIGQEFPLTEPEYFPGGFGGEKILHEYALGGKVIDHSAVAADGIANPGETGHLLGQCVKRPPGCNDDLGAHGNGGLQCGPIAGRKVGLPVQCGLVQVQGNELGSHGAYHSISFSAWA